VGAELEIFIRVKKFFYIRVLGAEV